MHNQISEIIKNICINASYIVLDIYDKYKKSTNLKNQVKLQYKLDGSPITTADKASNHYILSQLKYNFPNIPIISEESENDQILRERNFFLVDPLDGTKEFLNMNDEFSVNIGYVENHKAILGTVSLPAKNKIYWTKNKQSWTNILKHNNSRLRKNKNKRLFCNTNQNNLSIAVSRSHLDRKTDKFIRKNKFKNIKKIGSSLKIIKICENKVDLYPRFGTTMEWDICAAHAILKASGGAIITEDKQELIYGKKNYKNPEFFAYGDFKSIKKYI